MSLSRNSTCGQRMRGVSGRTCPLMGTTLVRLVSGKGGTSAVHHSCVPYSTIQGCIASPYRRQLPSPRLPILLTSGRRTVRRRPVTGRSLAEGSVEQGALVYLRR